MQPIALASRSCLMASVFACLLFSCSERVWGQDDSAKAKHLIDAVAAVMKDAPAIAFDTTEEANRVADDTARSLKDGGVSARPEARAAIAGRAAQEIIDLATSEDAGLIVMGSRGMSDWEGLLVGSVAHKVLHLSSVPVLIVR